MSESKEPDFKESKTLMSVNFTLENANLEESRHAMWAPSPAVLDDAGHPIYGHICIALLGDE